MKQLITFPLVALFAAAAAPAALGCVCEPPPPVAEALKEADAVFSGRLIGAEYRKGIVNRTRQVMEEWEGVKTEYGVLVLKFEAERWWKGGAAREVVLVTEQTRAADGTTSVGSCEYEFAQGERYLVYAYESEGRLQTGICTRTKKLKRAAKDLKALGKGRRPL